MNMKRPITLIVLLFLFIGACTPKKTEKFDLLILNSNIVDIENGTIHINQLVGISADTIRVTNDMSNHESFEGTEIFDAQGKFLMPGLWDNHVHFRGGDSLINENKKLLTLFLAYGITTVRDAGGDITPSVLKWRNQIKKGELIGPSILTSGPKLDGENPTWAGSIKVVNSEDIIKALDSLESIGVDYVKMYDGSLTKEMYYGIIQEAEKRGIKTTGHMPLTADINQAIDYGLDGSEHIYYILKACSPLADSLTELNMGYGMMDHIIDSYDTDLASELYANMSSKNVFITPTLHIGKTLAEMLDKDHSQDSLQKYIGKGIQQTYQGRILRAKKAKASGSTTRKKTEIQTMKMIVPMFQAGVKIIAGSDCGAFNSYVYPGQSLHQELVALVRAGLTPHQALKTSLTYGPMFFDLDQYYGSVSSGKVADLLLLEENPLDKIEATQQIIAVIKAGRVYRKELIDKMMADIL